MNNVILKGRLVKDPNVTCAKSGSTIAKFTVACDRTVKTENGYENQADFISCTAFGKAAELIEKHFAKGAEILVKGSIKTGSYEKDGQKIYTTDVLVDNFGGIEFCGSKKDVPTEAKASDGFMQVNGEDMPF